MQRTSFTLMELIMVMVIIGILAAIALPNFGPMKERAFDKEAEANLKLILAGERIWRMENNTNEYVACSNTSVINNLLRLSMPTNNPNWNYSIRTYTVNSTANQDFCAQANRTRGTARYWKITAPNATVTDPQVSNGTCP